MVFHKIVAEIKSKSKPFLLNLVVRLAWSVLISVFLTFLFIFSGFVLSARDIEPTPSLLQVLAQGFMGVFIFFLVFSFPLTIFVYVMRGINRTEWGWQPEFSKRFESRLKLFGLETRIIIANGARWASRFTILIVFLVLFMWMGENRVGGESLAGVVYPMIVLVIFFIFTVSNWFGYTAMTRFDWTIFHFEKFTMNRQSEITVREDLKDAFRNYNRLLGSSLTMSKLHQLCGYTVEAYKIADKAERRQMDEIFAEIVQRLKNREVNQANRCLIRLSELATRITEQHGEILGFKVKYPLRYSIVDWLRGVMDRIIVPFALFLLYALVWIALAYFHLLPSFPPSPPI